MEKLIAAVKIFLVSRLTEKVYWNYGANLQGNINVELRFQ